MKWIRQQCASSFIIIFNMKDWPNCWDLLPSCYESPQYAATAIVFIRRTIMHMLGFFWYRTAVCLFWHKFFCNFNIRDKYGKIDCIRIVLGFFFVSLFYYFATIPPVSERCSLWKFFHYQYQLTNKRMRSETSRYFFFIMIYCIFF